MGVEPRPRPWALPKTAKKGKKTGGGSGGRPNKRMLRVPTVATDATAVVDGSDSDSDSDDQKDAESFKSKSKAESEGRASTEVVVKNAAVGAVSPVAVMPGAGKSTRPLRRPGAVVPRNLGSRASKSASRPSVDRRSATASAVETPAQTTAGSASNTDQTLAGTKDAPSAAQGKAVEGNPSGKAADNEPSIMSDMVVSNTFTAGGVGRTDRSLNGGSSRNNPVSAAADSSTSAYSAGHKPTPSAAAQKETTGAQRSRGRSGEIVPTGSPAHKEAAGAGSAKGPKKSLKSGGGKTGRLKAAAAVARFRKNPRKAKRRSSATLPARDVGETQPLPLPEPAGGPVLAPELEPEPSPGEAQARLAADLTSSLLEEALLEICGPRQEWNGNLTAASLGAASTHDRWDEFEPPDADELHNIDVDSYDAYEDYDGVDGNRGKSPSLSHEQSGSSTQLESGAIINADGTISRAAPTPAASTEGKDDEQDEEQDEEEAESSVYQYPEAILAAAKQTSLPQADPKLGYAAARRRLREWEAGGGSGGERGSRRQRRPLSAAGGSAGLLRLTRRSKDQLVPLQLQMGAASAAGAGGAMAAAFSRSSATLAKAAEGADPFVRRESPPRSQRVAIYT